MTVNYIIQTFKLTIDWVVHRNEFYNIDPLDNITEEDKFNNVYCQEDLLLLQNGEFHLDLGWYGSDNLDKPMTGFMLVLFRGLDWNNCELLELVRTRSNADICLAINEIIKLVTEEFYSNKTGYKIDENESRQIGQHFQYSVRNNLNELLK